MLPDIRAVIAAILAAAGLLMVAFGLMATFRVAQEHHSGSLQADLAKRGRSASPDAPTQRAVTIINTPGPHLAPVKTAPSAPSVAPAAEPTPAEPMPVVQVEAAPLAATPPETSPPASAPPIGGPFAPPPVAPPESTRNAAAENSGKAEKIAAAKARARAARERKAAAKRAAQVRRAREKSAPAFGGTNQFGNNVNQLGATFRQ